MAIDLVSAALDALAAHLTASVPSLTAKRGWPESNQELDLSSPKASITEIQTDYTWCSPKAVEQTGAGSLLLAYRVAWVKISAQLDLWANFRVIRDAFASKLEAVLHNRLPFQPGLYLASAYHNRPLTIMAEQATTPDDDDTAHIGSWRRTWNLVIETDAVIQATHPELAEAVLRTETDLSGNQISEDKIIS